jgi:hypothetical protein
MLAEKENSYEDNFTKEASQKNKNSYKLRILYFLTCMRPKTLNGVLVELLQGCHEVDTKLYPSEQLSYLEIYDKNNVDLQKLIEAIYEILCQINDNINDGDMSLSKSLKEMLSVGELALDEANNEEYRPFEEIKFETVLEIASVAMEKGPYETEKIQQFSDEENEKEWFESAEYLYSVENDRLHKESMDIDEGKAPLENLELENLELEDLDDLDEDYSSWRKPVHEILTNKEENAAMESEATHLCEGLVEKSIWLKFKRMYKGSAKEDQRDLTDHLIDDVYEDILLQDSPSISELTVHSDDVRFKEDNSNRGASVHVKAKSKWFSDMDIREDTNTKGYYGNVKFLGLFSLKKGIFVEKREDIRTIENNIHPLLKEFANFYWVTSAGTRVAYY